MGNASSRVIENPEKFWDEMASKLGDQPQAMCWSTKARQIKRFEVLSRIITKEDSHILDLGCGSADFLIYLQKIGWNGFYTGIDISQKMIDLAERKPVGSRKTFIKGDIAEIEYGHHDYVILSGTLNHRFFKYDLAQYSWAEKIIRKMWTTSELGMAFNMRSIWGWTPTTPEIFAYNPSIVLGKCRHLTSRIIFDHSYFPHDFTILMYKEPWK